MIRKAIQTHEEGTHAIEICLTEQMALKWGSMLEKDVGKCYILTGLCANYDGNIRLMFRPGNGVHFITPAEEARTALRAKRWEIAHTCARLFLAVAIICAAGAYLARTTTGAATAQKEQAKP